MAGRLRVNPTRMELMKLRRRLAIAVHGHELLKDKLEGLVQEFMNLVKQYKDVHKAFDAEYGEVMKLFVLAGITGSQDALDEALAQCRGELELTVTTRNLLSVRVPRFEAHVRRAGSYSLLDTPLELDEATARLAEFLPTILHVAALEESLRLVMQEIQRTRRRVNALEYIMIPALRETIKYIQSKLDENERGNITRLMKINDMRLAREREAMRQRA